MLAWQQYYLRDGLAKEQSRIPAMEEGQDALGERTQVERIPTRCDRSGGFVEAFGTAKGSVRRRRTEG